MFATDWGAQKHVNEYLAIHSLMLRAINCNKAFDRKMFQRMPSNTSTKSLLSNMSRFFWSLQMHLKTWQLTCISCLRDRWWNPAAFIIRFSTIFHLYLWMPMLQNVKTNSSEELLQEREIWHVNLFVLGNINTLFRQYKKCACICKRTLQINAYTALSLFLSGLKLWFLQHVPLTTHAF